MFEDKAGDRNLYLSHGTGTSSLEQKQSRLSPALVDAQEPAQANSILAVIVHQNRLLLTALVSWRKKLHNPRQLLNIHNLNALALKLGA